MIARHLQTIFCDDIRHEVGGKLSYIGVYSGRLLVPGFPLSLPKLCVAVRAVAPRAQPFTCLQLIILKDEQVFTEGVLDAAQLSAGVVVPADDALGEDDRVQILPALFVFSPFQLDGPCMLRVRAQADGVELSAPGLIVEQAAAELFQQ